MVAFALALLIGATPGTSSLGDSGNDGERFKSHITAGERLYAGGDYGAAIWHFRRADEIRVTPEVAFNLARAHQRLGEDALAAYYYRLYLRRAPAASDALEIAERLADLLMQAEANGRGLLEVDATQPGSVTLEGHRYPELPVAAFLPPGDYTVQAHFPSGIIERTISLRTGKTTSVGFDPPPPNAPRVGSGVPVLVPPLVPARTAQSLGVSERARPGSGTAWRAAPWVVWGASAAALVSGAAFGVMSRKDASRAREEKSTLKVSEGQALLDRANQRGKTANVLWAAGGVGALAGGVLFVVALPEPGMAAPTVGSGGGR